MWIVVVVSALAITAIRLCVSECREIGRDKMDGEKTRIATAFNNFWDTHSLGPTPMVEHLEDIKGACVKCGATFAVWRAPSGGFEPIFARNGIKMSTPPKCDESRKPPEPVRLLKRR